MTTGICGECGKPLDNPNSIGYHSLCADIVYERLDKETDAKYPFAVVNRNGQELERFKTLDAAEEYLSNIKNSEIIFYERKM